MINPNLTQQEEIQVTSGSRVLGYSAGMTTPPRVLICNAIANITITLPRSAATLPTALGSSFIPGSGDGYLLRILNVSSIGTVTLAAASGDTLVDIPVLNSQYSSLEVCSAASENKWYRVSQGAASSGPIFITANSAPADAALANGEAAIWFDPTNGSAAVSFKAKQTDGTVVTAIVPLS